MARHDLVDYDPGIRKEADHWTYEYEYERGIVEDLKRFHETDPLALSPDLKAQPMELDVDGAGEISADDIEIIE